jgi:DNA repair exonuclease SbcCD ATPase subunit
MLHTRGNRIERIERRIDELRDRADGLLERELELAARLAERGDAEGWMAARRARRCERALTKLRERRAELAETQIQSIMRALQEQSQRTRERLDAELERLAPIEQDWERLREAFEALDEAAGTPALRELASSLHGALAIPEFPVREREGYAKPFPQSAVVF